MDLYIAYTRYITSNSDELTQLNGISAEVLTKLQCYEHW